MKSDKATDKVGQKLRAIVADIKRYVEKRIELVMLNSGEYFSHWIAVSVQRTTGALLLLGGVCFVLVALAIYLGNLIGSQSLGFLIVSIPLFVVGLSFIYLKPRRVFDTLQQSFEEEMIKAVEGNSKREHKKLESAEMEMDHSLSRNE